MYYCASVCAGQRGSVSQNVYHKSYIKGAWHGPSSSLRRYV